MVGFAETAGAAHVQRNSEVSSGFTIAKSDPDGTVRSARLDCLERPLGHPYDKL
jgi:hypothetical protein